MYFPSDAHRGMRARTIFMSETGKKETKTPTQRLQISSSNLSSLSFIIFQETPSAQEESERKKKGKGNKQEKVKNVKEKKRRENNRK